MMIRQSVAYLIANGCSAALGFLAVVIFTQLLDPADYGTYVVANSTGVIVAALLFTWLRQSILRFQSEGAGTDVRLTALAGFGLSISLLPLALLVLVVVLRLPWLVAAAAIVLAASMSLYDLGQELLRARLDAGAYMRAAIVRSVVSLALALAAIKLGGGGLGLITAVAAGYLAAAAFSGRTVWRRPLKAFDRPMLDTFITFGAPITVSGVLFALHMALDRLAVFHLLGAEAAGQYGAAADFVRQCMIYPALSASLAIAPLAVRTFATEGADAAGAQLSKAGELLLAMMLPAAVGLALTAPHLAAVVFGPKYRTAAAGLIPIVAFAWVFQAISQHYVHLSFNLAQRPRLYIVHGAATLAANVVLMVPLVYGLGMQGAAWSFMLAEAAGLAFGMLLARQAFPLPALTGPVIRVGAASVAMALAVALVSRAFAAPGFLALVACVLTGGLTYAAAAVALDLVGARALLAHIDIAVLIARIRQRAGLAGPRA